jgi:hypothetical protein
MLRAGALDVFSLFGAESDEGENPAGVSGALIWCAGDELVLRSGSNVVFWGDKTGNGRNLTQATAANGPTLTTINGRNALSFDPTAGQFLEIPDDGVWTHSTAYEGFAVFKRVQDPPTGSFYGFWELGASGQQSHVPFTDGVIYDDFGSNSRKTVGNPTPSMTSTRIYQVASATNSWTAWLDGVQLAPTTTTNTVGMVTGAGQRHIGLSGASGSSYDGIFCEFILFGKTLSTAERTAVKTMLNGGGSGPSRRQLVVISARAKRIRAGS